MPQAKQLQSRAEYLIKLFRKAQEQNHPGVPQAGSHNRKSNASSVSRDVTSAADEKVCDSYTVVVDVVHWSLVVLYCL